MNWHMETIRWMQMYLLTGDRNFSVATFREKWREGISVHFWSGNSSMICEGWGGWTSNTHRIHGTGIFTYIYHFTIKKSTIHVGKYTSPMDGMGTWPIFFSKETVTTNLPKTLPKPGISWVRLESFFEIELWCLEKISKKDLVVHHNDILGATICILF